MSSSDVCNVRNSLTKVVARTRIASERSLSEMRPKASCTSASTPRRVFESTPSGATPPGVRIDRNTHAVGQFTRTLRHNVTKSSPTCNQAERISSASVSASEPPTVASQRSSATASSRARRCAHWGSRKAQLRVTGTGKSMRDSSVADSSDTLKSKLRHRLRMEFRRNNNSNAAATVAGPTTTCPSSADLLSNKDNAFVTMRHLGTAGCEKAPFSTTLPPSPSLPELPSLGQKTSARTRIACVGVAGGSVVGPCESTDKQSASALCSTRARLAIGLRRPKFSKSIKSRETARASRWSLAAPPALSDDASTKAHVVTPSDCSVSMLERPPAPWRAVSPKRRTMVKTGTPMSVSFSSTRTTSKCSIASEVTAT
mmetsp:Transcript_31739/g.87680  ORF Transcript_31739/g.87680 Transcript_31739/m.87680 type:complete len:371 (+) Transcript_31739:414-1526(+)